jgi:hypothetical protein
MENLQAPGCGAMMRAGFLALAFILLPGCRSVSLASGAAAPSLQAARLGITQVGAGQSVRYVYCDEADCPVPTTKTPFDSSHVASLVTSATAPGPGPVTVDVAFPFNSSHVGDADKRALVEAVASRPGSLVEITARSDFVGPPPGQRKVVGARARAMRSIVMANKTRDVRIIERYEVAGPLPVADAAQARQRRGTVQFHPPIAVQPKGTPK